MNVVNFEAMSLPNPVSFGLMFSLDLPLWVCLTDTLLLLLRSLRENLLFLNYFIEPCTGFTTMLSGGWPLRKGARSSYGDSSHMVSVASCRGSYSLPYFKCILGLILISPLAINLMLCVLYRLRSTWLSKFYFILFRKYIPDNYTNN